MFVQFEPNFNLIDFNEKSSIQIFNKIRPVPAAVFHVDSETDRHDETKIHPFTFFEYAQE
jgi:hypothetical protein